MTETMTATGTPTEQRIVSLIRAYAMDAPRAANSGHPGTAMALAPLATVLYGRIMKHDPSNPQWFDRDRFILSAGHASILQYSVLHLAGYAISLDDIKAFRQWGSMTPGHPEVHHTPGIEVTTGPLGQGIANAVGMAMAEAHLRARFGTERCDHHTFVIAGDGCLQEGVSHEAASLAGHLKLGRLIAVYDDNHITIDGTTELSSSDDAVKRFESYGWHVESVGEIANDLDALEAALRRAMAVTDRPSLVVLRSHIGYPSPKFTDTSKAHGDPFPPEEIATVKELIGLDPAVSFPADDAATSDWRSTVAARGSERSAWEARTAGDADFAAVLSTTGIAGWADALPTWQPGESIATRAAFQKILDASLAGVPSVVGGGADLTGNTGTKIGGDAFHIDHAGRQMLFGIREHAMASTSNGMALHGGVLPIGGGFFIFSDYARPAVRLAALSQAKVVFVWTHDSVGLGEDGPTHQPVEQLASLRAMPGLSILRPADANETAAAWKCAVEHDGPTALILSRQALAVLPVTSAEGVSRGAYIVRPGDDVTIIGTGSEVAVALAAADLLAADGVSARVVSMPSWDRFAAQPKSYRTSVLGETVAVSVEAGVTFGWERYADASVGIDRFGASAPGATVLRELGITPEAVVAAVHGALG
jgi:transketolase